MSFDPLTQAAKVYRVTPPPSALPAEVLALLRAGGGLFHATSARAAGVTAGRLQRLVSYGLLARVGHGVYTSTGLLTTLPPWEAFAVRSEGFVMGCSAGTFASGWSAVALHGLAALGRPPREPTAVQPARSAPSARRLAYGRISAAQVPAGHLGEVRGCPVVGPAWATVELLRQLPCDDALVLADSALRSGMTRRALHSVAGHLHRRPGSRNAASWAIDHADGGAETALESLGRLACLEHDVPVPLSNVWIGVDGPLYRVDHLWPWHGLVAEADGSLKYGDPATAAGVIRAEKEREHTIRRRLQLDVVRYGWGLAAGNRPRLAARFHAALLENPRRDEPVRWWPERAR